MAPNRQEEFERVLKELDNAINDSAPGDYTGASQPAADPMLRDRRRNERRSVVGDRRSGERRESGQRPNRRRS